MTRMGKVGCLIVGLAVLGVVAVWSCLWQLVGRVMEEVMK